jgi:uncharacterized Zn ribbon protein
MEEVKFWDYRLSDTENYYNADLILKDLHSQRPVYVKVIKEGARFGSIAKLSPSTDFKISRYTWFNIVWDGRKNELAISYDDIVWLKNYIGPTVWVFEKNKPKPVEEPAEVFDCIGHQINVGDIVLYTRSYKVFGAVTKITAGGTIFYKIIKVREYDSGHEHKAYKSTDMLVIRDGLKKDLMLKRLIVE